MSTILNAVNAARPVHLC